MRPLADTEVVIVEAVRSPIGRRNGGVAPSTPPTCSARSSRRRRALRHRPRRGRPGRGRLRQPGRRADLQHRPHRVARRGPAAISGRHHRRLAVRLVPAGHEPRDGAGRAGVVDVALACGVESMSRVPIGSQCQQGSGQADPEELLRPLRDHVPVRGGRAHRGQVGHHPRRHRRLRPRVAAAGRRAWAEGRFERQMSRSTRPTSTTRASPTARPTTCARRGPARDLARGAGRPQAGRPRRTACTPPARRRRSPTARPRCCS